MVRGFELRSAFARTSDFMGEHSLETLQTRYDDLRTETSFEGWRQLSKDVLTALVEQQGLVIALQRRALAVHRGKSEEQQALRARAQDAFEVVQRLHQLRRRIHALIADYRQAASDAFPFALAARA
jgi:hypothetical protein